MKEKKNYVIGVNTKMYRHKLQKKNEVILYTIKRTGFLEMEKGYRLEREEYNSYCISVTISGNGSFTFKDKEYEITKNTVIFFDQNKHHILENKNDDTWKHYYIYFWGKQASDFYNMFVNYFGNVTNLIETNYLIEKIQYLHTNFNNETYNEVEASKTIYMILLYFYEQCIENSVLEYSTPAIEAEMFIREHYKEPISLDSIASAINISKYYLSHLYKEVWGVSIIKNLIEIRYEQCIKELKETNLTIEQILQNNQMTNKHLFIKMCKDEYKVTPSELRKKLKQK